MQGAVGVILTGSAASAELAAVTASATGNSLILNSGARAAVSNSILHGTVVGCDVTGDNSQSCKFLLLSLMLQNINIYTVAITLGVNMIGSICKVSTQGIAPLTSDPVLLPLRRATNGVTSILPISPNSNPPSPAVDSGDNNYAPQYDQLGQSRVINNTVDVGAFEYNPANSTLTLVAPSSVFSCGNTTVNVNVIDQFGFVVRGYSGAVTFWRYGFLS